MNEINKMKRLRVAAEDEGEAVKIRAVKEAEAEAARTEIQAKADAEAKYLAGLGISRQRQAIMEGLRESVNSFKTEVEGVDAKTVRAAAPPEPPLASRPASRGPSPRTRRPPPHLASRRSQVLDLMIVTQYFDMMKEVGAQSKSNAVFLNHSPGELGSLTGCISKGFMSALPAAPGFSQPMGR